MTLSTTASTGFRLDTIEKALEIEAPREMVWRSMLECDAWPSPFGTSARPKTKWQLNGDIVFEDDQGNGLVGKIFLYRENETLSIKYMDMLKAGREDRVSNEARQWIGAREVWDVTQLGTGCVLTIEKDIPPYLVKDIGMQMDEAMFKIQERAQEQYKKSLS